MSGQEPTLPPGQTACGRFSRVPWPTPSEAWAKGDLAALALVWGLERFSRYADSLGDALGECMEEAALGIRARAPTPEQLFLGPRGTPAFVMLAWVAESVLPQPEDREILGAAAEAMLCAYLAVRCQDDRLDQGSNPYWTFLEHALMARTGRLLAEVSDDPVPFLEAWERQVATFGEAAARDAALRVDAQTDWNEPGLIALQGDKFLPMAWPLTALLWRGARREASDELLDLVRRIGIGLQLANDLFNAEDDLLAGIHTPYLQALGIEVGLAGSVELAKAVVQGMANNALRSYLVRILLSYRKPLASLQSDRLARHLEARIPALQTSVLEQATLAMGALMRAGEAPGGGA